MFRPPVSSTSPVLYKVTSVDFGDHIPLQLIEMTWSNPVNNSEKPTNKYLSLLMSGAISYSDLAFGSYTKEIKIQERCV